MLAAVNIYAYAVVDSYACKYGYAVVGGYACSNEQFG